MIKKFQCQNCMGVVETQFEDEYVVCGHCGAACIVPKEFGPGTVIDDFVIAKLLGEGGMGNVYLAHQFSLDRKVALKILKEDFLKDPKFKDEFIYEARSVACLNHPNIIQAFKVGEENGVVFFAMEYVEGRNLKDILKEEGAINEKLAISIAMEIVSALGYAWNLRKLVHRDIKPENIMMTNDGTAKLMDLGLSLRDGDNKDEGDMIAGTPQYISPEQILGTDMDIRGDFYCLGATLYHLVSGKLPFEGSLEEIVKQHLSKKPLSLRKLVPGIDDFFAKIIHKMMSKQAQDRYENAETLLAAFKKDMKLIEDAEHGKRHFKISTQTNINAATQTSRFQRPKRKDPLILASLAMLALLLGGFLLTKMLIVGNSTNSNQEIYGLDDAVISGAGNKAPDQTHLIESNKGLYYRYFHTESKSTNGIKGGTLMNSGVAQSLSSAPLDRDNKGYGIIYNGFIEIPYSESYQFYLKVDSVCRIEIDGQVLFDFNGKVKEKKVMRAFNKGFYPIKIIYKGQVSTHLLDFKVESISINETKVPFDWFYRMVPPKVSLEVDESKKGLNYSHYKNFIYLSDAMKAFPDKEGVVDNLESKPSPIDKEKIFVRSYEGILKLPKQGEYTFYLKANLKATLKLNDVIALYSKAKGTKETSIKLTLSQLNRFQLIHAGSSGLPELELEIEGQGLERQAIPSSWFYQEIDDVYLSLKEAAHIEKIVNPGHSGRLQYLYYQGKFNNFSDMKKSRVRAKGLVPFLHIGKSRAKENFGFSFYGSIKIPVDDDYTFTLDSDDDSTFTMGRFAIYDNLKVADRSKTVKLTKGKHNFHLNYIQRTGSRGLKLYIRSKRFPKMEVPRSWFDLPETKK